MQNQIEFYIKRCDQVLEKTLKNTSNSVPTLVEAMNYVIFSGGKRLRPLIIYLIGDVVHAPIEHLDAIAASIELLHCYSLVHDDLPAMDNDDYRRGKLTCHRAYNEATAILVGDALQSLAFEILISQLKDSVKPEIILQIIHIILKAIGHSGMIAGQYLDLTELSNPDISLPELINIHSLKTGKLFECCVDTALLLGHPSKIETEVFTEFSRNFGIVFQMQDDYIDAFKNIDSGKKRASDQSNQKMTFAVRYNENELKKLITDQYSIILANLNRISTQTLAIQHFIDELVKKL